MATFCTTEGNSRNAGYAMLPSRQGTETQGTFQRPVPFLCFIL